MAAGEIASRFPISGPSISRHLGVLKGAGLVRERRDSNRILYSLVEERLATSVGNFLSGGVSRTGGHTPEAPQPIRQGLERMTSGGKGMRVAITGGTGFVGGHLAALEWTVLKPGMIFGRGNHMLDHLSHAVPLISKSQVRIIEEEVVKAVGAPDALPADLVPATAFDETSIRRSLPAPGPFRTTDLRCCLQA